MNRNEIKKILKESSIHPNKKLGQNFLCNQGIIEKIIEKSSVDASDNVLEIGPGLGILTKSLCEIAQSVTAVEIDSGIANYLKNRFSTINNLKLIHADFLNCLFNDKFTKSISNLPYYCASEVLFNIALKYNISEVYIMLQKEMAQRIVSGPGTKDYGALTVTLGLYYEPSLLFNIDRKSFHPQPEVASCFIKLKKNQNMKLCKEELDIFHDIVKSAFWGRRKTILKALNDSPHLQYDKKLLKKILMKANIDEKIRGEKLGIESYKDIATLIYTETNTGK